MDNAQLLIFMAFEKKSLIELLILRNLNSTYGKIFKAKNFIQIAKH